MISTNFSIRATLPISERKFKCVNCGNVVDQAYINYPFVRGGCPFCRGRLVEYKNGRR